MKKKYLLLGIYLPLIFILTGVAVALRSAAAISYLDFATGYYTDNSFLTISVWLIVGAVLAGASYLIIGDREMRLVASFDTPATYIPSSVVAVALLFMAAGITRDIVAAMGGVFTEETLKAHALPMITALLAILAVIGFLTTSLSQKRENLSRAAFGIMTVLFIIVYAAMLYFDSSMPKNAPDRVVDLMAYVFASMFFLYEIRLSLGRDVWFAYIAFGMMGASVCAYSSIPALVVYFTDGHIISSSIYESVLTLALFVFMTARMLMTTGLAEDKDTPLVEMIKHREDQRRVYEPEDDTVTEDEDPTDASNYTFDLDTPVQNASQGEEK